jgi:hypothetical protein
MRDGAAYTDSGPRLQEGVMGFYFSQIKGLRENRGNLLQVGSFKIYLEHIWK